jgi:hypothetical protein
MALLNISQAGSRWGVSRATIYRYKNKGDLSVIKEGKRSFVDTSEMMRVFGDPKPTVSGDTSGAPRVEQLETTADSQILEQKIGFLEEQNKALEARLDDLRSNEQRLLGIVEAQTRLISDQRDPAQSFWGRFFKR